MKTRVLLVDDAKFMRLMLRDILEKAGYEVVSEASNGKEAIREYQDKKPDLVTMDIIMPEVSGVEAATEIIKSDPSAKILMVSAMGQQELVKESLDAGACDFIVKPFVSEEVLKKVKEVLNPSCVNSK
jgi:two-component system chemotaxis response regulator CheY